MFRPGSSLPALSLLLLLGAPSVRADLEVTGEVVAREPLLEVRVVITNPGDEPAGPLDVVGELFSERREARVARGVPAGGEAAVLLGFDATGARPGIHALTRLLEHPMGGSPGAGGNGTVKSLRAYLLLTLGPVVAPAVALEIECAGEADCRISIDQQGGVPVRLSSVDGKAHQVSVRPLTARGLRPASPPVEVDVPSSGSVSVRVPVVRTGTARGSPHGVLVLAETSGGAVAQTAVARAVVEIEPAPALLPRLRPLLLFVGLALLAAAVVAEWRQKRQRSPEG